MFPFTDTTGGLSGKNQETNWWAQATSPALSAAFLNGLSRFHLEAKYSFPNSSQAASIKGGGVSS